ncbi:MAG: hypothetical protein Alis3KO_37510 [Aliiglaciecola sp.]
MASSNMRILIIVVTFVALISAVHAHESTSNTISVNGQGNVEQIPDILKFTISVQEKGVDSTMLSRAVNNTVNQILHMLTNNEVLEKDIQAMSISLHPWYEREGQNSVQKGFVFSRNINVTLRNFSRYPQILEQLFKLDASRVEGFRYEVEDQQSAYLNALKLAMKDAKTRAKELMTMSNKKLGDIANIVEVTNYRPLAQSSSRSSMVFAESSQYLPGSNVISASVTVTFNIE